eukprot:gb/GEZN01012324.1/.p1 GENE.gb/GEZN01012324.1/~~gb/GEZN01012324.1/.p1  ORF type:complete len:273 (+),score=33.32 gb/GEZN01012324.1/:200-1018(+)
MQLVEQHSNSLAEAHVRVYAIRSCFSWIGDAICPSDTSQFQVYPMRLRMPSDEQGGMLLTVLPSLIQHDIDEVSPLMPTSRELAYYALLAEEENLRQKSTQGRNGDECGTPHMPQDEEGKGDLESDENDEEDLDLTQQQSGSPNSRTPGPPQSAHTSSDKKDTADHSVVCSSEGLEQDGTGSELYQSFSLASSLEAVKQHLQRAQVEVVVVLEGVDLNTSQTTQARQSYTLQDISFNSKFAPCVSVGRWGTGACVDMRKFHALVELGLGMSC